VRPPSRSTQAATRQAPVSSATPAAAVTGSAPAAATGSSAAANRAAMVASGPNTRRREPVVSANTSTGTIDA
jgi:hypothetical protein